MLPLKAKLLAILLVCCMLKPFAQTSCVPVYVNQYASSGHMEPYMIKALADSTFLIAGRGTANGLGPYDGMVIHTTATGTIIWSYLIGGAANDEFTGIAVLADSSFILSGSTASYGHPESKGWLVHINKNGNLIWSRQIGSTHTGTDRIKAITQYSDKDIIGTFNEDDSTNLSNPVVFKMGEDGTLRWCTKFDNGKDDSYTSIAFSGDTMYASGYYSLGSAKKAVITQLNAATGAQLSSRNIYRAEPDDQEITGLEIFDHKISYGLRMHGMVSIDYTVGGMVYVQTDLAGTKNMVIHVSNGDDGSRIIPFRTIDSGFYMLRSYTVPPFQNSSVFKINRFGRLEWGRMFHTLTAMANIGQYDTLYARANLALAVTADNGLVSAHFFNDTANHLNQMGLVRINKDGESGDCQLDYMNDYTDTTGCDEKPFSFSSVTIENPDQLVVTPTETVNTATLKNLCQSNLCVDKSPLPTGCSNNYRIEYGGGKEIIFHDAISTPDGGLISIGDYGITATDALAMKTDAHGQPVWTKRFENFYHYMQFMRIIKSADNNYWIFAHDMLDFVNGLYIDLIKIDSAGNVLYSVQLDASGNIGGVERQLGDAVSTPDGGFILLVNDNMGSNNTHNFVFRYDAHAGMIWQKEITHPVSQPAYRSISCSPDAVFLAYDYGDYTSWQNFGVEKLDLNTGKLIWSRQYGSGSNQIEMINRIYSINDTTYTFVNNFDWPGPYDSISSTRMVKVDPAGHLIGSYVLNGETMIPGGSYPYQSPATVTITADNDFVLCGRASVNGINKLNIARFDKKGNASWSRNFESAINYALENIHPLGTGFLIVGRVDELLQGYIPFENGYLLRVDGSGQITNNAAGDCRTVNRPFSASSESISETVVGNRQAVDLSGISWKPINLLSLDLDVHPTSHCTQTSSCSGVMLKQKGNGCSLRDTLVFYLQGAATCGASATWQYDSLYFHFLFSIGDTIWLQPVREGRSVVSASMDGNCSLNNQQINTQLSRAASSVNLGRDTVLCTGRTVKLSAGSGFENYLWNDGSMDSTLTVSSTGKYYVQVSDYCNGKASDSIRIDIKDCEALLVFPNGFTPNHDGLNDVFRMKYPGRVTDYNLQIFNRFGQKIFETSDPAAGWDGDFSGQHQPEGTYIWIVRFTDSSGRNRICKGVWC